MNKKLVTAVLAFVVLVAGAGVWWITRPEALPPGFAISNGRVEADLVDVATQLTGRIAVIVVDEGDLVSPGDLLAEIDTETLRAQLARAQANVARAESEIVQARAMIAQREAALEFAQAEYDRSEALRDRNVGTEEALERRRSELLTAQASLDAARASMTAAERAADAARAQVTEIQTMINQATLEAPVRGRILYRLVQPGSVVGSGAPVVTLLDLTRVYMEVFLPTDQAARLALGAEARIRLDGLGLVVPATVSFISPEAQFTPEHVETPDARADLMFRVRLRVPQELIEENIDFARTGMRGTAWVRLAGSDGPWPAELNINIPPRSATDDTAEQLR